MKRYWGNPEPNTFAPIVKSAASEIIFVIASLLKI